MLNAAWVNECRLANAPIGKGVSAYMFVWTNTWKLQVDTPDSLLL